MRRRPWSAVIGGGESLSDSSIDVFGKDGLPGQARQCRTAAFAPIAAVAMTPPGFASVGRLDLPLRMRRPLKEWTNNACD